MEEHPIKKPGRLEMVSVFMGPDSATKMEISAMRRTSDGLSLSSILSGLAPVASHLVCAPTPGIRDNRAPMRGPTHAIVRTPSYL